MSLKRLKSLSAERDEGHFKYDNIVKLISAKQEKKDIYYFLLGWVNTSL